MKFNFKMLRLVLHALVLLQAAYALTVKAPTPAQVSTPSSVQSMRPPGGSISGLPAGLPKESREGRRRSGKRISLGPDRQPSSDYSDIYFDGSGSDRSSDDISTCTISSASSCGTPDTAGSASSCDTARSFMTKACEPSNAPETIPDQPPRQANLNQYLVPHKGTSTSKVEQRSESRERTMRRNDISNYFPKVSKASFDALQTELKTEVKHDHVAKEKSDRFPKPAHVEEKNFGPGN